MKKPVKLLCVTLCVLLCVSVLFSAGTAFYGHSHNCIGKDCQYCQAAFLQQELLRLVLSGCFSGSFALIFVQMLMNISLYSNKQKGSISLVANKVKLTA